MKGFDFKLVNPLIEQYIQDLSPIDDKIINKMHKYAEKTEIPIVGPLVGRVLYLMSLSSQADRIFELGSGFGYSAYWFSKGLKKGGKIVCSDYAEENKTVAEAFFDEAKISNNIDFITGNSLNILEDFEGNFDIIFNDIDKEFYPSVIDIAHSKLKQGGMLITDNVLWYGRVVEDNSLPSTKAVKEYNSRISIDKRFFTTIIPLRDGLSISIKLD